MAKLCLSIRPQNMALSGTSDASPAEHKCMVLARNLLKEVPLIGQNVVPSGKS